MVVVAAVAEADFHPLKAGRRLQKFVTPLIEHPNFHPLKAGRRQVIVPELTPATVISIPSRRVGDGCIFWCNKFLITFPSPQGGSETLSLCMSIFSGMRFPSPQGGSETRRRCGVAVGFLKFPSPQGGSETKGK